MNSDIDTAVGEVPVRNATYLGDGAYVVFDGFSYWLLANSHIEPTDRVCLEPSVMRNLDAFRHLMENK